MTEKVNHPAHYNMGGAKMADGTAQYEAIKVIEDWQLGFKLGNALKYILRAPHKGSELEDLKKARWYLERFANGHQDPYVTTRGDGPRGSMASTQVIEAWLLKGNLAHAVDYIAKRDARGALLHVDAHIVHLSET